MKWFSGISLVCTGVCLAQPLELLTIQDAVAESITSNLGLLAERTNIPISEARILTARLRPNPVLTVEGDHLDLAGTGYNSVNNAGPAEYSIRSDFHSRAGAEGRPAG